MKTIRKTLALILSLLALFLTMISCSNDNVDNSDKDSDNPGNAQSKPSEGLEFKLNDDGESYSVIGSGSCYDKVVVVPSTYDGLPVTGIIELNIYHDHSIILPDSIEYINQQGDNRAFSGNLKSIAFGSGIEYIGKWTFGSCDALAEVVITDIKAWCEAEINSNPMQYSHHIYDSDGNRITDLVIPEGTTRIGNNAFESGTFKSVSIPNSVKNIGSNAFYGCTNLESVSIPNSVTSIGDSAFSECKNLTSVSIPNSVTNIGSRAFYSCSNLTSVTFPTTIRWIQNYTFAECPNLNEFRFEGTMEEWYGLEISSAWKYSSPFVVVHCTDGDISTEFYP